MSDDIRVCDNDKNSEEPDDIRVCDEGKGDANPDDIRVCDEDDCVDVVPMVISGPGIGNNTSTADVGSGYTVTGGEGPYKWSFTHGTIDDNGVITIAEECDASGEPRQGTVSVSDSCGGKASVGVEVRMSGGVWVTVDTWPHSSTGVFWGTVGDCDFYPPLNPPSVCASGTTTNISGTSRTIEGWDCLNNIFATVPHLGALHELCTSDYTTNADGDCEACGEVPNKGPYRVSFQEDEWQCP